MFLSWLAKPWSPLVRVASECPRTKPLLSDLVLLTPDGPKNRPAWTSNCLSLENKKHTGSGNQWFKYRVTGFLFVLESCWEWNGAPLWCGHEHYKLKKLGQSQDSPACPNINAVEPSPQILLLTRDISYSALLNVCLFSPSVIWVLSCLYICCCFSFT